jgi:ectoine hydroxylase-related dioxygenase (phytanoyl-CoA dioxygenase family)
MTMREQVAGSIPMPPLARANPLLGDRAGLHAQMEREGYLFFQGVLDKDAVADIRRDFMDVLVGMGVVDSNADAPIWNGADLGGFPIKFEQLHEVKVWERFVANPRVNAFFRDLLGEEPFWLPIVEYRIFPPLLQPPEDPFFGRHQDGFYNGDLDCWTCWVPLADVDLDAGGIAMASGQNKRGYLHDTSDAPQYPIPDDAIPLSAWRRSAYKPGDVVVFNRWIPHCGMHNFTRQFRLSMDIRVMPKSGDLPVWGKVISFAEDEIVVANHDGRAVSLKIDEGTYSRWTSGKRIETKDLIRLMPPGEDVLAFHANGRAIMLRPPR